MIHFLPTLVVLASIGQPDPGTVAVVGGDLPIVTFSLPASTPYRLGFSTIKMNLWFNREKTAAAAQATTYFARSRGDLNGDLVVDGRDIRGFVSILTTGPFSAAADFNVDGAANLADVPGFVEALLGAHPAEGVFLYVEGLSPSAALADAPVNLLTDPDMDGIFTLAQSVPVTVVGLAVSPTTRLVGSFPFFGGLEWSISWPRLWSRPRSLAILEWRTASL